MSKLIQTSNVPTYLNDIDRLNIYCEITDDQLVTVILNRITTPLTRAMALNKDLCCQPSIWTLLLPNFTKRKKTTRTRVRQRSLGWRSEYRGEEESLGVGRKRMGLAQKKYSMKEKWKEDV